MALTLSSALSGGACDTGDPYQGAVKLTPQAGIEAKFTAGKIKGDTDVDITLGVSICPSMLEILTHSPNLESTERPHPIRRPTLLRICQEKLW